MVGSRVLGLSHRRAPAMAAFLLPLVLLLGSPLAAHAQPRSGATALLAEGDYDDDGVADESDNCPTYWNPSQEDLDGDGLGDSCDENPGGTGGGGDGDSDGDGYTDTTDNCPSAPNVDQADLDGDGAGDACDPFDDRDADQDGVLDALDNCPTAPNGDQGDVDGDGRGSACDTLERPATASDCKKGGWRAFDGRYAFTSQGECLKQTPHRNGSPA